MLYSTGTSLVDVFFPRSGCILRVQCICRLQEARQMCSAVSCSYSAQVVLMHSTNLVMPYIKCISWLLRLMFLCLHFILSPWLGPKRIECL